MTSLRERVHRLEMRYRQRASRGARRRLSSPGHDGSLTPKLSAYMPHQPWPKQQEFLELDCQEALYGGAAGGGKSDAVLMAALQYVDVPGYSALLLRRTYADLSLPDALIPRSHEWLEGSGAVWNEAKKHWTFPSGATLSFGYLERSRSKSTGTRAP